MQQLQQQKRTQLRHALLTTLMGQLESLRQVGTFDVDAISDNVETRTRQVLGSFFAHKNASLGEGKLMSLLVAVKELHKELANSLQHTLTNHGIKRQVAMLVVETLHDLKQVLNAKTAQETIDAKWAKIVKGISGLGDLHTKMWDDALENGLTELLRENKANMVMMTHALDSPLGATLSLLCVDAVIGLNPSPTSRFIYSKVMHEKLESLKKAVTEELETCESLHKRYSDLSLGDEVSSAERKHREKALEAIKVVKQEVLKLDATWKKAERAFKEEEKEVHTEALKGPTNWSDGFREKVGILSKKKAPDIADVYLRAAQYLGKRWEGTVAVGKEVLDGLIREAGDFLGPLRHIRMRLTYAEPVWLRIAYRFQFPKSPADGGGFQQLDITSNEATEDANGVRLPEGLMLGEQQFWYRAGDVPTIVMGNRCVLRRMKELGLSLGSVYESENEYGGYFIINGTEKILRILTTPRTNIPIRLRRGHFARNGKNFSDKAIMLRSKMPSGRCVANYLHYINNGEIVASFAKKYVTYIPVMMLLLSLKDVTLVGVLNELSTGLGETDVAALSRVEALIQHHGTKPYRSVVGQEGMVRVLGRLFRELQLARKASFLPECVKCHSGAQHDDVWYGRYVLRKFLFPHLNCHDIPFDADIGPTNVTPDVKQRLQEERDAKFDLLVHTIRSLHAFVDGRLEEDIVDRPSHQEVFTLRNMFVGVVEDCMLRAMRYLGLRAYTTMPLRIVQMVEKYKPKETLNEELAKIFVPENNPATMAPLTRIFTTGSYKADADLGMPVPQLVGLSIVLERMNIFRIVELLRGVHRGRHILDMRSSEVRRCAAESWGFYCVVHTPDGEACGVQNQLSLSAYVTTSVDPSIVRTAVQGALKEFLIPPQTTLQRHWMGPVFVEGLIIGYVAVHDIGRAGRELQIHKATDPVLEQVEVVAIPQSKGQSPLIHIFSSQGRMMRPVREMPSGKEINVGTWEQTHMDIASVFCDFYDSRTEVGKFKYIEPNCANLLSITAAIIPFFEHNCSPRNLFQCGITKQSVGPPIVNAPYRHDTKLYHQTYTQKCVVRTSTMDEYGIDDTNVNVNAVLCVTSYTGLDMEDALILNHSGVQRGMFSVYQTLCKEISADKVAAHVKKPNQDPMDEIKVTVTNVFHNLKDKKRFCDRLGINGLPLARRSVKDVLKQPSCHHGKPSHNEDDPLYVVAQKVTKVNKKGDILSLEYLNHKMHTWRELDKTESGTVHCIVPTAFDGPDPTNVYLFLRLNRDPVIGDKFCSRHGQKGTVGFLMPQIDLPFSSSGIVPDVVINPHAFPSRMAVGMMLEILAGKFAALEGTYMDASPWAIVDDKPVSAKQIGDLLVRHGLRPCGAETLYNGFSGEPMEVDTFIGLGGYQRLRHMVKDKWQARSRTDGVRTRVERRTGQPEHGRKKHGGVRVGEMERDALISHGAAEVVIDRLLNVSDKTRAYLCGSCGGMLSFTEKTAIGGSSWKVCYFCKAEWDPESEEATHVEGKVHLVDVPYVLKLMVAELAGVGIRTCITMKDSNSTTSAAARQVD